MRNIEVVKGGAFTTVQDLGRYGYQRYGVPVSGALDQFALRVGNVLVGNEEGDAGLEVTLMGPTLKFQFDTIIAITGADLSPVIDGKPIPGWTAVPVSAGGILSFKGPKDGIRSYVCVRGGVDVPKIMGSRSTFTRSQFGGFLGRPLVAEDMLAVAETGLDTPRSAGLEAGAVPRYGQHRTIRVVMGPQDEAFTTAGVETFLSSTFIFTPMFDRMGHRLDGPAIEHEKGADIVSDGTSRGAVQVPGSGKPIILLADCGTTGGYTKIATVVSADLPWVAQSRPGGTLGFQAVTVEEAHTALREQEAFIASLKV